jgi:hypothetical protein
MTKAEEIEAYIAERKKEYSESVRYYILKEEREGKLNDEDVASSIRCDAKVYLLEQIGSTFFNWE